MSSATTLAACQPKPAGKSLETITSAVSEKREPMPPAGTTDFAASSRSERGALACSHDA